MRRRAERAPIDRAKRDWRSSDAAPSRGVMAPQMRRHDERAPIDRAKRDWARQTREPRCQGGAAMRRRGERAPIDRAKRDWRSSERQKQKSMRLAEAVRLEAVTVGIVEVLTVRDVAEPGGGAGRQHDGHAANAVGALAQGMCRRVPAIEVGHDGDRLAGVGQAEDDLGVAVPMALLRDHAPECAESVRRDRGPLVSSS